MTDDVVETMVLIGHIGGFVSVGIDFWCPPMSHKIYNDKGSPIALLGVLTNLWVHRFLMPQYTNTP